MKIYQVIEFGGEYDDYYEFVIGTFLNEEKAIAEMNNQIEKQKSFENKYKKCTQCDYDETRLNKECFKQFYDEDMILENYHCDNFIYVEEKDYKIEEFEVIE